jgi:hypothetical protein
MHDFYTGLDQASFTVTTDFEVNGSKQARIWPADSSGPRRLGMET